jgi:hypothetical protein
MLRHRLNFYLTALKMRLLEDECQLGYSPEQNLYCLAGLNNEVILRHVSHKHHAGHPRPEHS